MTPEEGPFKYVELDEHDRHVFEGRFELADDGCPDSGQHLVVTVTTDGTAADIDIHVETQLAKTLVVSTSTDKLDGLQRLLYGAARVETVRTIVPV